MCTLNLITKCCQKWLYIVHSDCKNCVLSLITYSCLCFICCTRESPCHQVGSLYILFFQAETITFTHQPTLKDMCHSKLPLLEHTSPFITVSYFPYLPADKLTTTQVTADALILVLQVNNVLSVWCRFSLLPQKLLLIMCLKMKVLNSNHCH